MWVSGLPVTLNKWLKQTGFIAASLLVSLAVAAAEEENAGELEAPVAQEGQATPATQQTDGESAQEPDAPLPDIGLIEEAQLGEGLEDDGNFVPSIQITEDLPVAFPVDI
jgi:hypothetical protein